MSDAAEVLVAFAESVAEVVPALDAETAHDRWSPGIGPVEEENQVRMILEALGEQRRLDIDV